MSALRTVVRCCVGAFVVASLGLVIPACGGDGEEGAAPAEGEKITIRISSEIPLELYPLPALQRWTELAKEATDGRVEIKIFPNAQLFTDDAALDAVASGQLEMAAPPSTTVAGFAKELEVLDLPGIFEDDEEFFAKVDGELGEAINESLQARGLHAVAYWSLGPLLLLHNEGEDATRPEDFRGKKLRIFGGRILEEMVESLDATPTFIPAPEAAAAVQQGLVEGTFTDWDGFDFFQDLFKFGFDAEIARIGEIGVVNNAFWEGLPDDIRATLEETLAQAVEESRVQREQHQNSIRDEITAGGKVFYEISPEDHQAWVDAMASVRERYAEEFPEIYELATK